MRTFWRTLGFAIAVAAPISCAPAPAAAEGWDSEDEELTAWFQLSEVRACCDRRDAYLADDYGSDKEGHYVAIITDGSANEKYGKPAIPNGTRIVVPADRLKGRNPPPGGRGVIFLAKNQDELSPEQRTVYCYWAPGGG